MKNSLSIFTLLILFYACSTSKKISESALLINNATIINVLDGSLLKEKSILIDQGIIQSIGSYSELKNRAFKKNHIDIEHKYVIPGLWDMHAHIDKLSDDFEHSKSMLSLYALNGVTSIREMGGNWSKIKKLQEASKQSHFLPTIFTAGPILENKTFVDWVAKVDNDPEFKKQRVRIAHKSEVEIIIDSVKKLGVDFLKIRTAASKEVFFEIAKQAKLKGLRFAGHVDAKVDLYEAVKSGISSLEHLDIFQLSGMSNAKMDSIVSLMKEMNTGYSPTLTYFKKHRIYDKTNINYFLNDTTYASFPKRAYASKRLLEKSVLAMKRSEGSQVPWKKMEANFLKFASKIVSKDVTILAGTDGANALILPGFSLHEELRLYHSELKMTPLQILQSATINPATYFDIKSGLVKQGYNADLVILEKNPLSNMKNTETIHSVLKSGKMISNQEILERLKLIRVYNKKTN